MSSTEPGLMIAVDIGGTFTDVTLQDPASGRILRAKTPSTPHDPSEAFIAGLHLALEAAGARADEITRVLHGTTVATNLILEGKGAAAALVTTAGFRHVLAIGRQDIPRAANLYAWVKPDRPVPPRLVMEVAERVGPGGAVLAALDEESVARVAERLRASGVAAVAVCLLHSFAYPAHERRVAELLRAALPGVAVTVSVDVLPEVREYERSLATVLNARVMPAVGSYVARLEQRLAEAGVAAPLLLMQSNGGVAGAASVRRAPILTALSGPAAGVVGAQAAGAAAGFGDLITIDIGGTSADICLLRDGAVALTSRGRVGVWPLPLPMVDMVTIGAGGGSIARVEDGALLVGPQSAGSRPGPACYGHGGAAATVTDAHVVLGHLPPRLLGGRMVLDPALAAAAVARVAAPLGLALHDAARGILAIADSTMIGAIRVVSVERGHDPRRFALMAFGGAGPLHGCALADMLGAATVLIPPAPGVLCADGLLAADLRADFASTVSGLDRPVDAVFAELEHEAQGWLASEAVPVATPPPEGGEPFADPENLATPRVSAVARGVSANISGSANGQRTRKPASTGTVMPVTYRASSLTSHRIALLMSTGSIRSIGMRFAVIFAASGFSSTYLPSTSFMTIGVRTPVGWTVLTRMLCGESEFAKLRIRPTTPCFAAA